MNGKLILALSLFGLAMGVGTVFVIPSTVEPLFWLAIFVVCAAVIARKAAGRYFLHGFLVSMANCVWVTGAHVLLFTSYAASHSKEMLMMARMPLPDSPRLMMLLTGPVIGVASGILLGLFAFIASKLRRKGPALTRLGS
ncbi:MAG: hypothetical protein WCG85_24740 [Polyangia bacterium]